MSHSYEASFLEQPQAVDPNAGATPEYDASFIARMKEIRLPTWVRLVHLIPN